MSSDFISRLPLAHIALDRDYLAREQNSLFSELWTKPETLVLPMFQGRVLLSSYGELKLVPAELVDISYALAYLGKDLNNGMPIVLANLDETASAKLEPSDENWHTLRKSGIGLSPRDASIFTQGLALANWHASHTFCPVCGRPTEATRAGWVRVCRYDERELFPRTDPAIIVGVVDDQDRILLGSQGVWEDNRFSILAGFVEPGESLEAAVIREMREEAGIEVAEPKYLGSQAWPFPYSLMLGYLAKYVGGDVVPDGQEIVKLRWFTREELKAESAELLLPGKLSIARAIIEHWLGEDLPAVE